jgi:DNA-binding NtrC family response regulator
MVLLVEPDDLIASRLTASLDGVDEVHRCVGFTEARAQLRLTPPDLLVSNLRLREYNGLQLVYLGTLATTQTPAIIYTTRLDPTLAEDVQRAGAFYDTADCLAVSLRAYLGAALPPRDRRDPERRAGRVEGPGRRLRDH